LILVIFNIICILFFFNNNTQDAEKDAFNMIRFNKEEKEAIELIKTYEIEFLLVMKSYI
jgi:hypothetical protein